MLKADNEKKRKEELQLLGKFVCFEDNLKCFLSNKTLL